MVPVRILPLALVLGVAAAPAGGAARGDFSHLVTYDEIRAEIERLRERHPTIVSVGSLGKTVEGRDIPVVKISDNVERDEDEPEVCFMAGVHSREQVAIVSLLRFLREIVEGYGTDPEATELIDGREIWVLPILNADGLAFDLHEGKDSGAAWRKNRRPNPDGSLGVDLNRQFPVRWRGSTQRADDPTIEAPSAERNPGTAPLSEPEVQALARFFEGRPLRAFGLLPPPLPHPHRGGGLRAAGARDDRPAEQALSRDHAPPGRGHAAGMGRRRGDHP